MAGSLRELVDLLGKTGIPSERMGLVVQALTPFAEAVFHS
jgi:hypothetical protein